MSSSRDGGDKENDPYAAWRESLTSAENQGIMNEYVNGQDVKKLVVAFFESLKNLDGERFKQVMSNPENKVFVNAAKELDHESAKEFINRDRNENLEKVREQTKKEARKVHEVQPGAPITKKKIDQSMRP